MLLLLLLLLSWEWALVSFIHSWFPEAVAKRHRPNSIWEQQERPTTNQSSKAWDKRWVKVNLTTLFVETTCEATFFYMAKDECCCFGHATWSTASASFSSTKTSGAARLKAWCTSMAAILMVWKVSKRRLSVSHHKTSIPYRISCCDWNHRFLRGGNHFRRGARPIC